MPVPAGNEMRLGVLGCGKRCLVDSGIYDEDDAAAQVFREEEKKKKKKQ